MSTKKWEKAVAKLLVGKTVKAVSYLDQEEVELMGWSNKAIAIEFDDGTVIYPSCDDEGNDAGALFTTSKKLPVIPVIR